MKVAIIGAGISGLSAAYDLQKSDRFEVSLFESSALVGGKIQTAREGEFLIEQGPDSIFSMKPWAVELMIELGMESALVEPLGSEFCILSKGKLHAVPRALASLVPSASGALEKVGFLTASAKRRALQETDVEPGGGADESVASFFRRRFGKMFSEMVAEPLLAGTHAGDPEKLSMAALYPSYLGMERSHGSVAKAAAARTGNGNHKGGFLTLRDGMGSFPNVLAERLTRVCLRASTPVLSIRRSGEGLVVVTDSGEEPFDRVILAVPAFAAAKILGEVSPEASERLATIRFVSTAIVSLAYERDAFRKPLHGNGFLVPTGESSAITGCTWSSNKWAGRAPEGTYLIRAFLGRDGGLDVDAVSDEELTSMARGTLERLLSPSRAPVLSRLDRWPKGMAQYELGHVCKIAAIEAALEGLPVQLVGSSYRGNSIPDCVRQGREAAKKILAEIN